MDPKWAQNGVILSDPISEHVPKSDSLSEPGFDHFLGGYFDPILGPIALRVNEMGVF